MRGLFAAAAIGSVVALMDAHAAAQVYLRGQEGGAALSAAVEGADGAGVMVSEGAAEAGKPGVRKIVSWDRVREVRGEHGGEAAKFEAVAEALWRARTRLERGDFGAAEPLFEELNADGKASGLTGPSAAVLYEGLMRCTLHRGAQASAVFAYLRWRGITDAMKGGAAAPGWVGGVFDVTPIVDAKTGLCPSLPPVFLGDAAVLSMASSGDWEQLQGRIGALYRAAARFEVGLDANVTADASAAKPSDGERLVADVVLARVGDPAQRAAARTNLMGRLAGVEIEPWVEAWCRVGLGRSLLRESSDEDKRRGVLHLLHVPARLSRSSPYLASIALAEAATAMKEMGDTAGALALKDELDDRYARRSAAAWGPVREIRPVSSEQRGGGAKSSN